MYHFICILLMYKDFEWRNIVYIDFIAFFESPFCILKRESNFQICKITNPQNRKWDVCIITHQCTREIGKYLFDVHFKIKKLLTKVDFSIFCIKKKVLSISMPQCHINYVLRIRVWFLQIIWGHHGKLYIFIIVI